MAIINVPQGGQARSVHVQQVIDWLRGSHAHSEPVFFTGITSSSAYALTVANLDPTNGLGLAVKNSNSSITLFEAKHAGVIVRPNASTGIPFRVRNFADNADLFSVNADGTVSFGSGTLVTTAAAQTLTNKTLTAPTITSGILQTPVITSYADLNNQSVAPGAPGAGVLRVYEASDTLRYITSASVIRQLATIDGTETLAAKTLTTPVLTTPNVSGALAITQGAAPGSPTGGIVNVYSLTGESVLKMKLSTGTVKEIVDLDSVQTLSNKTISLTAMTAITLNNPVLSNYLEMQWSNSPGGLTSTSRLWAKNDNNIYYTLPGGTIAQILTNINTPSVTTQSITRSLALGVN